MENNNYDCLVLSGGGIRGIYHLGALSYFSKNGLDLDNIKIFVCTSIGSVIGTLLICGYDILEIFMFMASQNDFYSHGDSKISDIAKDNVKKIYSFFSNYGLYDIEILSSRLGEMIHKKFGFIPTLKELKDITGKTIYITVSNITESKVEYFFYENEPNLSILEALKMSCNIPLLFQRIIYKDCYYADGGILDNFPIHLIDRKKYKILGILLRNKQSTNKEMTLIEYIYRCLSLPIQELSKIRHNLITNNPKIIEIETTTSALSLSLDHTQKMEMFISGSKQANIKNKTKYIHVDFSYC